MGLWDHIAVCVYVYAPHPEQVLKAWTDIYETWYVYEYRRNNIGIVGGVVFCAVCVVWKESRGLYSSS
jgi:hypothetical protein